VPSPSGAFSDLLTPENEGITFLPVFGNGLRSDWLLHPRRRESLTTLSWKPQDSHRVTLSVRNKLALLYWVGRDSSVGKTTLYGLEGPGIESVEVRFSALVLTCPGAHPASYKMGTGFFPGVKRSRRGVCHPPQHSTEVKERIELYIYSPFGPSQPVVE
jgi:hypothetical protein